MRCQVVCEAPLSPWDVFSVLWFVLRCGLRNLAARRRKQLRQPREIDCHLSCLIHRQETGVPSSILVGPAVEYAELLPGGILYRESSRHLDDAPRCRKAISYASGSGVLCVCNRDRAQRVWSCFSMSASKA